MKLDRMLGILNILLQYDRVTAPFLAQKFEVNRRTINRDIDALCQAGIPIVTHQGAGGGISIAEGFKLDKNIFTAGELSGIVAALKGIGSVSEQAGIERTLDKLGASSSVAQPISIDLASYYKEDLTAKIEPIKKAIQGQQVIEFDYYYSKGKSRRRIEPYIVVFQWSSWYVFGYCLERQDWRMFKLNRLWELCVTGETFAMREIPPERRDFDSHFVDDIHLAALFNHAEKYRLIDSYGPDGFHETEEGLYFEFPFTNRGHLVSWLLSFGANVKVLKPLYIVDDIRTAAKDILTNYET